MIIRMLKSSDIPRLKEIYTKMGIPLEFPDLQEFLPIPVVVNENNEVVAAVGCMPAVEIYLFLDKDWETPGMRLEAFRALHEWVRRDLFSRGIKEAHAFVPPDLEKPFGKRLLRSFGWIRSHWPCFSRRTDYV